MFVLICKVWAQWPGTLEYINGTDLYEYIELRG